jgi:hypothetical protein
MKELCGQSQPRGSQESALGATVVSNNGQSQSAFGASEKQKIAHLFLVRSNLNHEEIWKKYFAGHEAEYSIYAHAKWPEQVVSPLIRGALIEPHCKTHWGHISLVEAELLLLREALKEKQNKFFLLHSEACVPIRSFAFVHRRLFRCGQSWLYFLRGDLGRYGKVNHAAIPENCFFKSSQFFCLTRDHAEYILEQGNPEHWCESLCPDEHYFPTILTAGGKQNECFHQALTFAEWNLRRRESPAGPTTFHELLPADVENLIQTPALFARKFAPDSDIGRYISRLYFPEASA